MNLRKAREITKTADSRLKEIEEAKKVMEKEKERELIEQAQKQTEVEDRKKLAARFPKKPNEVFTNCWNCGTVVRLNNTERKSSPLRVLRIAECPKCGCYQIDRVDNTIKSLEFDRFLKGFR